MLANVPLGTLLDLVLLIGILSAAAWLRDRWHSARRVREAKAKRASEEGR